MKIIRKMVHIDEDKCDGCGLCVPGCAEGALQIVDGKARLVSDVYCDGLGECLGECPQGAISIIEREAAAFSPEEVKMHLAAQKDADPVAPLPCGCSGMAVKEIKRKPENACASSSCCEMASCLGNWPVQITLVPPVAPYLMGARLLIAADCVPFAYANFHEKFVKGRVALVGCPKLDDAQAHVEKLASIFAQNCIVDIVVPYMEVPCCTGLVRIVETALKKSGKDIPVTLSLIGIDGELREEKQLQ